MNPSCPRCGGSGRNYRDLFACKAGSGSLRSRMEPCPRCCAEHIVPGACAKNDAVVADPAAIGPYPRCSCERCRLWQVEDL